jgi:Phage tail sheath protein subtilisin-like domain/Phage tail sheath C-terminal domain
MPEYRTPGVYIEELSGGPRPVQPSSTTDTAFVAVLTLPTSFQAGKGMAAGMFLPGQDQSLLLGWNRARSFRPLLTDGGGAATPPAAAPEAPAPKKGDKGEITPAAAAPKAPEGGNRFSQLVNDILPGRWTVGAPSGDSVVVLTSEKGESIRMPANRTMLSVKVDDKTKKAEWDLSFQADETKLVESISGYALLNGVAHSGNLNCVDAAQTATLDIAQIHERMVGPAPGIRGQAAFAQWRYELAERLFKEILMSANPSVTEARAANIWEGLNPAARLAWERWLRAHPGMFRLELAMQGFFTNGGATAYPVVSIQAAGAAGPNKRELLQQSLDGLGDVAMICAPGLEKGWQDEILAYAGPKGRGDMFAVLDTPRYLLTKAPRGVELDSVRWVKGSAPYEVDVLETLPTNEPSELRFLGFANDTLLDQTVPRDDNGYGGAYGPWLVVENPLSTGPHDRYVVSPPSGFAAGVIAFTDLKAGGGVHKAPANEQMAGVSNVITEVSDREQGALNVKGINIIRHRPGGGIRVWGARTTGADALWRYINVRRLFLFVERSVRTAVNWAVFLPNSERTRRDLATTIRSFLYSLWNQGMLDGASHSEAYNVKCDKENNPDVDVRSGMLTVDVQFKPLYPAEFVRIRFRQAPMEVPE